MEMDIIGADIASLDMASLEITRDTDRALHLVTTTETVAADLTGETEADPIIPIIIIEGLISGSASDDARGITQCPA